MSYEFFAWSSNSAPSIQPFHDDWIPVGIHAGTSADFLRRHEAACSRSDLFTTGRRHVLAASFMNRVVDSRNLWLAARALLSRGRKAPGPNGETLYRLTREQPNRVRAELRKLGEIVNAGTYLPGPARAVEIPKSSGKGIRKIEVANWQDLVLQRAIVQVIQPALDPLFDDYSFGFRPRRGRFEALAAASSIIEQSGSHFLVCADLKDAFTTVPHKELLDRVKQQVGNDCLTGLIGKIIRANGKTKGIPQGGPLSPLLLNIYVDGVLDQKWAKAFPKIPLLRYADDILLICSDEAEAIEAYGGLQDLLRPSGMRLKGTFEKDTVDLTRQPACWLGYQIQEANGSLVASVPEESFKKAQTCLQDVLSKADGSLLVQQALRGMVEQCGPCGPPHDRISVIHQLKAAAQALGTSELPSNAELLRVWERSNARFRALVEHREFLSSLVSATPALGSASAHEKWDETGGGGCSSPVVRTESADRFEDRQLTVVLTAYASASSDAWVFSIYRDGRLLIPTKYKRVQDLFSHRQLCETLGMLLSTIESRFSVPARGVRFVTNLSQMSDVGAALLEFASGCLFPRVELPELHGERNRLGNNLKRMNAEFAHHAGVGVAQT